ncbi:MAG: phosphopentomutase [Gammaproteobacteria bacterium]
MTKRAIILVLDSFGIGASIDAHRFGDQHANTLANIAKYCASQQRALHLPHLEQLGLGMAALASSGKHIKGFKKHLEPSAQYGYAVEISPGKDTPSGHWEMMGVPLNTDWGYFTAATDTFPPQLLAQLCQRAQLTGVLGNCHASGTEIIKQFGEQHIKTLQPIVYTSADSVFQIAAHEQVFGLDKLYKICEIARELVDDYNIGRVIARPFIGDNADNFKRTAHRCDYTTPPPAPTLLDKLCEAGGDVIAIGKIADIFAHQGISQTIHAPGNMALFDATLAAISQVHSSNTIIFTNFVDFDSLYGHRRDIVGYADALEAFDQRLPELYANLQPNDLVIITADHGCDPTQPGSDHTREHVPILAFGPNIQPSFIGRRESFADIGQTIAHHLELAPLNCGIRWT